MDKKTIYLSLLIVFLLAILGTYYFTNPADKTLKVVQEVSKENLKKQSLNVEGMTCLGCEVTLEKAVKSLAGVVEAKASLAEKSIEIEYDKTRVNLKLLRKTIKEKGYTLP